MRPTRRETLRRLAIIATPLALMAFVVCGRSAYLATSKKSQERTNLMLMARTPASLKLLQRQSELIADVADHIEDHSLSDVRSLLDETATIGKRASSEIQAQQDAWRKIQTQTKVDTETYRNIQRDLSGISRMQEREIIRLNNLLEMAQRKSIPAAVVGYIGTFLFGIFSSLLSSHLYDLWRKKRRTREEDRIDA